ncbi:MAG: citramalate synthase [Desulfobacca sp. 4484_104]|nr:MAG: citramalate synthase [Desulfobacca sp. 4484_104]RLA88667.1 MAG: citramalate synthase [Deltaproteobacteria bacterium]
MRCVKIYDTTLRDGTQAEEFNLSLGDKIRIARKLDQIGVHYIEGGWPGANPKDNDFFLEIRNYALNNSRITAFGSTHHKDNPPEQDPNLLTLIASQAPVITIFGKSSVFQVKEVLRTTRERNLELIRNSLAFLKPHVEELIYDAEHFFDGFRDDPVYALQTLEAANQGGAACLVLCDTNGGTVTSNLIEIIKTVQERFPGVPLGIHAHNDAEMAVANSIAAVELGCEQVQGTINGFGERCGNANLCSIIPSIKLKLGLDCITDQQLTRLCETSRFVTELANLRHNRYLPYVGRSAFAHKGGMHAAAVLRNPRAYEHIDPELVGNERHIPVSELSGKGSIILKAREFGLELSRTDPVVEDTLKKIKQLEHQGFQFEGAEASLELLLREALGQRKKYFQLLGFRVIDQKVAEDEPPIPEATIRVHVGGNEVHTAAIGKGPVNALDKALLKALTRFYPRLAEMRLEDYKVRVLPDSEGTGGTVRVLIESADNDSRWGTVGVSFDIIEASWQALVDSINYKLFKDEQQSD